MEPRKWDPVHASDEEKPLNRKPQLTAGQELREQLLQPNRRTEGFWGCREAGYSVNVSPGEQRDIWVVGESGSRSGRNTAISKWEKGRKLLILAQKIAKEKK